jgi:hypothetical protein
MISTASMVSIQQIPQAAKFETNQHEPAVVTRATTMDHCDIVIDVMIHPKFWSSCVSDRMVTMESAITAIQNHPSNKTLWLYYPLPILHQNYRDFLRLLPTWQYVNLVSNHGDEPLDPLALRELASDNRIVGIYVNNVPMDFPGHEKVHFIPIGYCSDLFYHQLQYHWLTTIHLRRVPFINRFAKNHPMVTVMDFTPTRKVKDKALKVLCCIGSTGSQWTSLTLRSECKEYLQHQPFGVLPGFLEKESYFKLHEEFAFEVSPFGNGVSNFRDYESLLLHTFPILFHSPIDSVYKNLPVMIVSTPQDITEQSLQHHMDQYGDWFDTHDIRKELDVRRWLQNNL